MLTLSWGTFVQSLCRNDIASVSTSCMNNLLQKIELLAVWVVFAFAVGTTSAVAGLSPDFNLVSLEGKNTTLASQIDGDKWLLLMFWATDCVICQREKPLISRFHTEHKDIDAQVVGIALDGYARVDKIQSYLAQHNPSFPSYTGEYSDLANSYSHATGEVLRGTPTYLLYTPEGELVANNPGPVSPGAIEKFIEKYRKSHD